MRSLATALALIACLGARLSGQAGGFIPGDLYLHTPAATGISSDDGGMIHVDMVAGTSDLFLEYDGTHSNFGAAVFDPYRKRILFCATLTGVGQPPHLWQTDAFGNIDDLGYVGLKVEDMTSTGGGRIYLHFSGDTAEPFRYLDGANRLRTLLDETGSAPFEMPGIGGFPFSGMLYDPTTNALFLSSGAGFGICSAGSSQEVNVHKIPLSAAGSRVKGAVSCTQFDVDVGGSVETPVSWSHLPSQNLLLVVDTNSNAQQSRMVEIDPVTLATSAFASNGTYTGAGATNGGVWSNALGKAVILDTYSDVLRSYSAGETGDGTIVPTTYPLSRPGSSGDEVTLLEIPDAGCLGAFGPYSAGLAGSGGFIPALTGGGCSEPGNLVTLHLFDVVGAAPGFLLVGPSAAALPYKGGDLLVWPLLLTLPLGVGGTPGMPGDGSLDLPGSLPPDSALSGLEFFLQALFWDAGAVQGLSMTQGLAMEIG